MVCKKKMGGTFGKIMEETGLCYFPVAGLDIVNKVRAGLLPVTYKVVSIDVQSTHMYPFLGCFHFPNSNYFLFSSDQCSIMTAFIIQVAQMHS